MIAIPLPFVIALLLSLLAILLFIRREQSTQSAFVFIALCALTTTVVGLRWTFNYPLFQLLQPILASFIPVTAWYCFSNAHKRHSFNYWHLSPPIIVVIGSFTYPFWRPPIDPILTLLYICYGVALISVSFKAANIPEQVRLSDIDKALKAERIAGAMLLMSATIDGAMAIDFAFFNGDHSVVILTTGHAVLLPMLAIAVIMVSLSVAPNNFQDATPYQDSPSEPLNQEQAEHEHTSKYSNALEQVKGQAGQLTEEEIKTIVSKLDTLFTDKEVFLDPDLTLDRLARKTGIPARQISNAINHVYGRNISQVVNEYRIERAKNLLLTSDKNITQIYLDSGFQTKSNFNREFTRITQQTPSAYRRRQAG